MALKQQLVFSQSEIMSNGIVQVRMDNQVQDDSVTPVKVIASEFVRHVICPGDDYSQECEQVQAICKAVHTPEVIAAYQSSIEVKNDSI